MYALTGRGMQYIDEYTISAGIPSPVLMENASRGVADAVAKRFPDKETRILVVSGVGNNGGDAICATRWLMHMGYKNIKIFFTGTVAKASPEFSRQVTILAKAYDSISMTGLYGSSDISVLRNEYDVIIDGMFGIGLNRSLDDSLAKIVEYINLKKSYRVAVDIPSGLNSTTGQVMGGAIRADLTVTFGSYKTGMLFGEGRTHCGSIEVVDIGLLESAYDNVTDKIEVCDDAFFEETAADALLERNETGHKGTFGTVGIVVSSNGMLGASMLASKAAYRAGCGLVKIFCPLKYVGFFNVSIPEAVVVPYKPDNMNRAFEEFANRTDVFLIGPGLKEDDMGKELVKEVLQGETPAVLDAGALNIIAKNLKMFRKRKCKCVITPHLGEMAKLTANDLELVAKNRIGYTKSFSEKYKVSMVVKSDISLISIYDDEHGLQDLYVNITGNSGLATAGSGDVLAGVIASLIAQGNTLDTSLLYGVMIHGRAGEKFAKDQDSKRKMMAGDIIDNLF